MTPPPADPRAPARAGTRRLSLTTRFAVVSLLGIAAVGAYLVTATSQALSDQARADGTSDARALALRVQTVLPAQAFSLGVDAATTTALVPTDLPSDDGFLGLRLWTADGRIIFDSSSRAAAFPDVDRLDDAALRGDPTTRVIPRLESFADGGTDGTAAGDPVLDVYVPLVAGGELAGAAEVLIDYGETAAAQARTVRTLGLVATCGLLLLWLVLFRIVHNASTRLQRSAMDNARMALLDALTGLPNRRMLLDRLDRAVASAHGGEHGVGILLLDVDRFKDINDSLGHDRGDELLVEVAARLIDTFRGRDVVARLGGDEFAVLLPGLACVADAEALAQRARAVFSAPFRLGEMSVHVATSIGVAALPEHATDASDLMRKADVAMYSAKQHRLGVAVYRVADDESSPARLVLQAELHRALTTPGELAMHYQPTVDLGTGATVGLEALMRWRHPSRGDIDPGVFVPLAEQSGLIESLTEFALATVVADLARWHVAERLPVAVNLSAHTVTSGAIVERILALLAEHHLGSEWLEVEITETAVVRDPGRVVPVLRRLAEAGVRVAIDDFGVGSTSLAQLRDLPVDVLKIDQVFIGDLHRAGGRGSARAVVKAMVDLAHSFGMRVVAEGVEDATTAATLRDLDVDRGQGFWFSPALPAAQVLAVAGPVLI